MNELVFRGENGTPMTNSYLVAETFGKEHNKVCRDIEKLDCSEEFQSANFGVSFKIRELPNGGHKQDRYYNITRDGFTFLAMGYTGKKAAEFKEKYIAAFNAMEQKLNQGNLINEQFLQTFVQTQTQMMNQMMQLCNTMIRYMGGAASPQPQSQPIVQPQPKPFVVIPEEEPFTPEDYPMYGVVTSYRKLRQQYPKHITVMQAAELFRLRGISIRKASLFRFLREGGLISSKNATYHRPSAECVKKGWMVCISGRRVSVYPNRHYHTPYLSPEFVDILERKLSAQSVKALELWKEVQP